VDHPGGWLRMVTARRADETASFADRFRRQAAFDHDEAEAAVVFNLARGAIAVRGVEQIGPRNILFQHMAIGIDNTHRSHSWLSGCCPSLPESSALSQGMIF